MRDPATKWGAIEALGNSGDRRAIVPLTKASKSENASTRKYAQDALKNDLISSVEAGNEKKLRLFKECYIILFLFLLLLSACAEKDPVGMKWKYKGSFPKRMYKPIVADNTFYISTKRYLYALEIESGKEKWTFKADKWGTPSFFVISDELIGVWSQHTLHAINTSTGQRKWMFRCKCSQLPLVSSGMLYLVETKKLKGEKFIFICARY